MKKLLPIFIKGRGFTLIELMVVVAIIAILAVVGFAIFQNAQKNARDGIRRGEINNLAKSIESAKDPTVANYLYSDTGTNVQFTNDYPTNKPRDPAKDPLKPLYCVATSTTATPTDPASWAATSTCPTGYSTLVDATGAYNTSAATNALNSGIRYWKICARLEVAGTAFCIGNSQ